MRSLLTERQLEIVLAVVYEYIQTGEPAGSRTIAKKYLRGRSAATIRNEMADLEEMGYLYQPHTSAGRLPSPKAYRVYVDSIMHHRRFSPPGLGDWMRKVRDQKDDLESILSYVSRLLGRVTSYLGVAAVVPFDDIVLQRVDFVRVSSRAVLIVVVLDGGLVHHRTVSLPGEISQSALDDLARCINTVAVGCPWREVHDALYAYVIEQLEQYWDTCRVAMDQVDNMLLHGSYRLFTGGVQHILGLPDFADIGKLQTIFSLIEEEGSLAKMVRGCALEEGVKVTIGDENPLVGMQDCSVVLASSNTGGQKSIIGLIGPLRMNYEHSIAVLETVLHGLSEDE